MVLSDLLLLLTNSCTMVGKGTHSLRPLAVLFCLITYTAMPPASITTAGHQGRSSNVRLTRLLLHEVRHMIM